MRTLRNILFLTCLLGAPVLVHAAGVDINSADAGTLATALQGIGPHKAEAIVAYRKKHGPFKSVDELTSVKGIGASTVEQNRDRVSIGTRKAPAR